MVCEMCVTLKTGVFVLEYRSYNLVEKIGS